jgi:hypothetical protein
MDDRQRRSPSSPIENHMNERSLARRGSRLRTAVGLIGMLMLAACASAPPAPTASLDAAKQAIANAERADASRYAVGELNEARIKLAAANGAITEQRMVMAERFAEGSRAEAELATAKTGAAKANAVNDEMRRSTGTLIEEMQRSSGGKP